jgi:hypothetical protein
MSRRRRTLWFGLALVLLVTMASLALLYSWSESALRQADLILAKECFKRIELGLPHKEIDSLLKEYGFQCTHQQPFGEVVLMNYELVGKEVAIILCFDEPDGPANYMEFNRPDPPQTRLRRTLARALPFLGE